MGLHQPAQRTNFLELQLNIIIVSYYQSVCVLSKQYNACDNLIGFGMCVVDTCLLTTMQFDEKLF